MLSIVSFYTLVIFGWNVGMTEINGQQGYFTEYDALENCQKAGNFVLNQNDELKYVCVPSEGEVDGD